VVMAAWDVISLNRMITGFIRDGTSNRALVVYKWMVASGLRETPHTFSAVLGACNSCEGLQLHGRVLALGLRSNPFVMSALVNLYMRVETPCAALLLYDEMPLQSTAMSNAVLGGLCNLKLAEDLFRSLLDMRRRGLELNGLSYCYAMKACYQDEDWLEQGRQLHGVVLKAGWVPSNIFLSNSLVDLYAATGDLVDAKSSLDDIPSEDVISWNSIVSVCASKGRTKEATGYLRQMLWHGKTPSVRSFVGLFALSGQTGHLQVGVQMHGIALKLGFSWSSAHVQTALISMYGNCCHFDCCLAIFNETPSLALECYNAMITSSIGCKVFHSALEVLYCMVVEGVMPDNVTLSATMKAISLSASPSLISCQMLHSWVFKLGFEADMVVCSSLISAYARAGQVHSSRSVFESLRSPNVVCFTSMISACARHGDGAKGVELLREMVCRGLKPDDVTFLCAITGCDQAGLIEEGRLVFEFMRATRELGPDERHLACMVNLLGRDGFVEEAMKVMMEQHSPLRHYTKAWSSLVQSCKAHGEDALGRRAADTLVDMGREDAATSLQVSRYFYEIGDGENVSRIKGMASGQRVKEISGRSSVEIGHGII
jgi:pentatricopeptide repeat protein